MEVPVFPFVADIYFGYRALNKTDSHCNYPRVIRMYICVGFYPKTKQKLGEKHGGYCARTSSRSSAQSNQPDKSQQRAI